MLYDLSGDGHVGLKCDEGEIYLVLSAVFCVLCRFLITQDDVCACAI